MLQWIDHRWRWSHLVGAKSSRQLCWWLCVLLFSLSSTQLGAQLSLPASTQLTALDFQRTPQGHARLLLSFNQPVALPEVIEHLHRFELRFAQTQVAVSLLNQYDARDFATLVSELSFQQHGTAAHLVIHTQERVQHLLSRQGNQWILDLAPADPARGAQRRFRYTGSLMSFHFQDIPVRQLLTLLAEELDLNLITGQQVQGNISLHLDRIPSDQALDIILTSQGLASRQSGRVLLVAPAQELADLEAQQRLAERAAEGLTTLEEAFIRLNYANAVDLRRFLLDEVTSSPTNSFSTHLGLGFLIEAPTAPSTPSSPRFMSERGQLLVDERTNMLYVRDTPEQLERIRSIIAQLDIPIEQIMIEARIVVARTGASQELGIQWGAGRWRGETQSGQTISGSSSLVRTLQLDTALTGQRGVSGMINPAQGASFGFVSNNLILDLELAALEAENRSEVISQPRVLTADRHTAIIRSGEEIPYTLTDNDGNATTNFRQAELRLEVTPHLVGDGRIALNLRVNNDSRGEETSSAGPVINTNAVETHVMIENGGTLVIGGIYTTQMLTQNTQVPFLGRLPLIGWLFRHSLQRQENVELLIFITPRLLPSAARI